jgi:hypothetical protein
MLAWHNHQQRTLGINKGCDFHKCPGDGVMEVILNK